MYLRKHNLIFTMYSKIASVNSSVYSFPLQDAADSHMNMWITSYNSDLI